MYCSRRWIVLSEVTLSILMLAQSKLCFQDFRDNFCEVPGTEYTGNIVMKMKLSEIILCVLDCGFSMVSISHLKENLC
jgi:hypothetical protein